MSDENSRARGEGAYLRPVESCFGTRAQSVEKLLRRPRRAAAKSSVTEALPQPTNSVDEAADCSAGLFDFGGVPRAPSWQASCGVQACTALAAYDGQAVVQVRSCALERGGPETAREALRSLSQRLSPIEVSESKSAGSSLPTWLARHRYCCELRTPCTSSRKRMFGVVLMPERARRHWARISSPSGTSLSKAYGAIRRFSYDVDLTYGIRATAPDPVDNLVPQNRSQSKSANARERLRSASRKRRCASSMNACNRTSSLPKLMPRTTRCTSRMIHWKR